MTIIVAVSNGITTTMGCDSSSYSPESIQSYQGSKLISTGQWVIGYTGSGWGTGQLAAMATMPKSGTELALRRAFVPSMKKLLDKFGGSHQSTAQFLIGGYGKLYEVDSEDWGIVDLTESAIGGAYQYSLGSLHSTRHLQSQKKRVQLALDAAIECSPAALGPTKIITI